MATLAVVTVNRAYADMTAGMVSAAGGGDNFVNTGAQFVAFTNGGGSSITITEVIQQTVDGQSVTSRTVTVPAGKTTLLGPYSPSLYNDGNSKMNFTYSAVTSLTVGVFQLTTS